MVTANEQALIDKVRRQVRELQSALKQADYIETMIEDVECVIHELREAIDVFNESKND